MTGRRPTTALELTRGCMRIAWLLALFLLLSCSGRTEWPHEGTFSGVYRSGFEASLFVPKGTKEMWWLKGDVPCEPTPSSIQAPGPLLFVEVRASLSDRGSFGHLGRYIREISPREFLVCRKATPDEWKYLATDSTS